MISGHATAAATDTFVNTHLPLAAVPLGKTGLTCSGAGFGGYRIQKGIARHAEALRKALLDGVNIIDTSANYGDGGSEALIGDVLAELTDAGQLQRDQVVVVSKVGYLQGENYALGLAREKEGRPFKDVVRYSEGLSHCIHPEFIEDQLTRSLERLQLDQLDGYLLHNPEYFLGYAAKQGEPAAAARREYDGRIARAFAHLEREVGRGRIQCYGVSSNTFASAVDDPEFTSLSRIWEIAGEVSQAHHFRLIQMPLNLLEPGAVCRGNQPGGESVLSLAADLGLGVLINRPLNAFDGRHLIRLADLPLKRAKTENEIIRSVRAVSRSEGRLWRRILTRLETGPGLVTRIKQQIAIGDQLKHYWRNFGSYERWRQLENGNFRPRVQGVADYLVQVAPDDEEVSAWIENHWALLAVAFTDVSSHYLERAARKTRHIRQKAAAADPDWALADTLSQMAVRAVRSTKGVTAVLVGMRDKAYVADIMEELKRPAAHKGRVSSWRQMG